MTVGAATGPRWLEVVAVVATGFLHLLVSEILGLQGVFVGVAIVAWGSYLVLRMRRDRSQAARWGFTRRNLVPATALTTGIALVVVPLMAAYGSSRDLLVLDVGLIALLVLYPLWGLLQQLLVQALVAGNLVRAPGFLARRGFVVLTCAVLFGLVHVPDLPLSVMTFAMGLLFTPIYLRWRNLWPLGLWHGWLGAVAYRWVLGRDPWLDIFG